MNKGIFTAIVAVSLIGFVAYLKTAEYGAGYKVYCLAKGSDIGGEDQLLKECRDKGLSDIACLEGNTKGYHIAHTPREGGRCYFLFERRGDIVCAGTRLSKTDRWRAQVKRFFFATITDDTPLYGTHSGMTCYFLNPEHKKLINDLKYGESGTKKRKGPPPSYKGYGGGKLRSWELVRKALSF